MAKRSDKGPAPSGRIFVLLPVVLVVGVLALAGGFHSSSRTVRSASGERGAAARKATRPKVALGVSVPGPTAPQLESFTRLVGVRPRVVMWFETWDQPMLYYHQLEAAASINARPLVTWDPIRKGRQLSLARMTSGYYDRYIDASAEAAKRWRRIIYIRFDHEMNLVDTARRNGNTPKRFVAAWRHVVSVFHKLHVTNVRWVWSPNVYCLGHCPFKAYYPGNRWVDWVALDAYNYGPVDQVPWYTFTQLFGPSYAILTRITSKPVMVGETSSTELGGSKAGWIRGMGQALKTRFKRIRVLVWFDRVKETDWRVNSSASSLAAFRALVQSSLFLH